MKALTDSDARQEKFFGLDDSGSGREYAMRQMNGADAAAGAIRLTGPAAAEGALLQLHLLDPVQGQAHLQTRIQVGTPPGQAPLTATLRLSAWEASQECQHSFYREACMRT